MRTSEGMKAARRALALAHGGQTIPPAVLRAALADAKARSGGIGKEKLGLYREADRYRRKEAAPDLAGLRRIGDRIAKRKVVAPPVARSAGAIVAGSYTLRLTPGYDFGAIHSSPQDARNTAFVHRLTGNLGLSMYAERRGHDAFGSVSIGAFFVPMFGPARLRASINLPLSFAWWTISTGVTAVTLGMLSFDIATFRRDGTRVPSVHRTGGGFKVVWFNQIGIDLDFDFGSISDNPMTAGVEVDTDHFYLISLQCFGQAFSNGEDKPGFTANAGGILNATLPFIDLDLELIPVVSQAL